MITSHRLEDAPSLATTYFDASHMAPGAAPSPVRSRRFGFLDLPEDLDIVFGVAVTLLGFGSAIAALIVQW
jgi:hypothetical protein